LQYNVAILFYLGLNFQNFFLNFFTNRPCLTNTVKGCKKVVSFYSVNEYKIHFLAYIQVPVSAEMVPGERSKYVEVTEPGRAAEAFFTFEKNV
jgi:hypothetical protein